MSKAVTESTGGGFASSRSLIASVRPRIRKGPSIVSSTCLRAALRRLLTLGLDRYAAPALTCLPTCMFIHRHYISCSGDDPIEGSGEVRYIAWRAFDALGCIRVSE